MGFRVSVFQPLRFGVWGSRFSVLGLGLRVWGFRLEMWVSRFRVLVWNLRVSGFSVCRSRIRFLCF